MCSQQHNQAKYTEPQQYPEFPTLYRQFDVGQQRCQRRHEQSNVPAHAKTIVQERYQLLLLQVVTTHWRGFAVDRQKPFVVYVSRNDYYIVRFEFSE